MNIIFYKKKFKNEFNGIDSFYNLIKSNNNFFIIHNYSFVKIILFFFSKKKSKFIIHLNGLWTVDIQLIILLSFFFKIRTVVSIHGMLLPEAMKIKKIKKIICFHLYQKYILKLTSLIHCTSSNEVSELNKFRMFNFYYVPLGVEINPSNSIDNFLSSQKHKRNYVLFIGRFTKIKNLENLIKGWNLINAYNWKLLIVGPDSENSKYRNFLKNLIKSLHLNKSIFVLNEANDKFKNKLFKKSKFLILPSYSENFGIIAAEAMANFMPTIVSNKSPWSEVDEYKCGWTCNTDIESIANALSKATLLSKEKRIEYSINANKLISKKFNINIMHSNFYDMYKSIL